MARLPELSPAARPAFWLVALATGLGAALRGIQLLTLPPPAWVDEIWFALRARDILQTGEFPLFYKTFWGGVNAGLVWLTTGAQALGFDRVIVASRLVAASFSVLAIPLLYAALNELWRGAWPAAGRRWRAALAALALAGFFSIITLTRLGTEPGVALAAGLFGCWQYGRAVRTGRWRPWLLAGLAAGAAQYISPHARFIPLVLAAWGVLDALAARPAARRRLVLGAALAVAAAALIAAPLIAFFIREPEWFLGRARAVTVGAGQTGLLQFWLDNAVKVALSFSWAGDPNGRDNLAGRPLLDPVQAAGFYLGLVLTVGRVRRDGRALALLGWLGLMLTPGLVTDEAPSFSRLSLAAAPICALIAVGWAAGWEWARPRLGRPALWLAAGGLVVSGGWTAYDYFGRFASQPDLAAWYTATPVRLAEDLIQRAARGEAVFVERIPEAEDIYAFDFLLPGTAVRRLDFRQCLPLAAGRSTPTTYLVWSERDPASALDLRRAFPAAAVQVIQPESESLIRELTLIEASAGARAATAGRPAAARFAPGLELRGVEQSTTVVRPGESVFLALYWSAAQAPGEDLVTFTHLGGEAGAPPVAQRDGQPCQGLYPTSQWRAGDLVPDRFAVTIPAETPAGDYPLIVGWYRYPSLERLPLESADQPLTDNRALIGTVTVAP